MKQRFEVVITGRECAELLPCANKPAPVPPGCVAGPTLASLISAGTELNGIYQGDDFPVRPGYAAVFRIKEVGPGVEKFKAGDLALAMGHHQSYQQHPAEAIWPVPAGLSATDAVFARLMGVSMSTLVTTAARPPARVVVTGLGPVGHLAAQIFQGCGYNVLACDPDSTRRALAEQGGIAQTSAQLPLGDADWCGETALVLECSGHEQAALDGCGLVKKRGEVVLIGVPWRRRTEVSAHELLHAVFHRYAVLRSGWEWEIPVGAADFCAGSIRANIAAALQWLAESRTRVTDLYSIYNPRDCQNAYQSLLKGQEKSLAIVFDWTQIK